MLAAFRKKKWRHKELKQNALHFLEALHSSGILLLLCISAVENNMLAYWGN